jgi:ADP-heptose:LPS heptosyltransferase
MVTFSSFTALLSGLCGADRRVGFHRFHNEGLYRGEMLTHRVAYNPHVHIAKNFIALVDALTAAAPTEPYSKTVIGHDQIKVTIPPPSAEAHARILERVRALVPFDPARQRLVLINPNASELLPHRRWMPERYAELIGRILAAHPDVIVLITGTPEERARAEEQLPASCLESSNSRSLPILLAILRAPGRHISVTDITALTADLPQYAC